MIDQCNLEGFPGSIRAWEYNVDHVRRCPVSPRVHRPWGGK